MVFEGSYFAGTYFAGLTFVGGHPETSDTPQSINPKRLIAKIYDSVGTTYLETLIDWNTVPSFIWPINSGQGSLSFNLPRSFGRAGELGDDATLHNLTLGNLIKLFVVDLESGKDGILIYQGFIRRIDIIPYSSVKVTLVPRTAAFAQQWIDAVISFFDAYPIDIAYVLIGLHYAPGLFWDPTNKPYLTTTTGTKITETFQRQKLGQIFDMLLRAAGGWAFTRINADNSYTFQESARTGEPPTHRLKVSNLSSVEFVRSDVDRRRRVFVYGKTITEGDDIGKLVQWTAQRSGYDPLLNTPMDEVYSNSRIGDTRTAASIAVSMLEFLDAESLETTIEVPDSNFDPDGYDIESLRPGDTVRLYDPNYQYQFPKVGEHRVCGTGVICGGAYYAQVLRTLVIAEVRYDFFKATITLKQRPNRVVDELYSVNSRLLLTETHQ